MTKLAVGGKAGKAPFYGAFLLGGDHFPWDGARAASENAPPDSGFPYRVRGLAEACEQQAASLLRAAQTAGFEWTPLPDRRHMWISHELRPGANRPGPPALWAEFDRAVQRLVGIATEGRLMYNVAW